MVTFNQLRIREIRSQKFNKKKKKIGRSAKYLHGSPQLKGVCIKVYTTKPKKPNSAIRKVAKVKLSTRREKIVYIPGMGHNLQQHSLVMVRGGRVRDLPGVHHKIIRGKYDFTGSEVILRSNRRSKYGIKKSSN